jgi:hypothetical protein
MTIYIINEYLKLRKTTVLEYLKYYCSSIIECFEDEFLHHSTVTDTQHLLAKIEESEFLGMLESIDCMHWQ